MKSYKEYLSESKQTYNFKVKFAGNLPENTAKKIKEALGLFDCASCSSGKSAPITESHFDFPELKNIAVTVFDVSLNYPATSPQIKNLLSDALNKTLSEIRVRNPAEEAETILNHANDKKSSEALLEKDFDTTSTQEGVGEKHKLTFLKGLTKNKKTLEQYKGVNDSILAKTAPVEKAAGKDTKQNNTSPVGSRKVNGLPTAKGR